MPGPGQPPSKPLALARVAILVGIDEAGYGPLLGPLCVGSVVIEADSAHFAPFGTNSEAGIAVPPVEPPDLWTQLASVVCRKPRDRKGRIAVEDSKKLKRPNDAAGHPLEHLERGVVTWASCLHTATDAMTDDGALLRLLGALPPESPPWAGEAVALPLANDRALLGIASQRLRRALDRAGLTLRAIKVAALDAPEFNSAFERVRSKASVNTSLGLERLHRAALAFPDQDLVVAFDRHGGRTHYREELALTFPDATLRVLEESESGSRYLLQERGRSIAVSWESEAESRHLPVALASMAAKLVRELWMLRLNRYFAQFRPELKPTAGYVEDGRRWLAEVEPLLGSLGLERRRLVRMA